MSSLWPVDVHAYVHISAWVDMRAFHSGDVFAWKAECCNEKLLTFDQKVNYTLNLVQSYFTFLCS